MIDQPYWDLELFVRLLVATLLGGVVGLERERLHRAAGLRTHVLVSVGSALFTLVSLYGFREVGKINDPARVAAQIVSGIGFLGAGTIMRQGATVRGLTTAASLWVVAGIGMAAGAGYYAGAIFTTLLAILALVVLKSLERAIEDRELTRMELSLPHGPGQLAKVQGVFELLGVSLRNLEMDREDDQLLLRVVVLIPRGLSRNILLQSLSDVGVTHIEM
ncbi:MAG TPA: MgtC/SapB family protein [Candidatus Nitrosotenuis sp.]|jgi:putative Mg2+ transporter-C (MgtC) family protein|nr:MgtC/SapB family protein [Candidatus Nitrosotenuis sp.]